MKRSIVFILLLAGPFIATAQLSADSIIALIQGEVRNKRSKSIIVGIIDSNGRQIFAAGIKSDHDPALPDGNTMYEIGSITKVFTSLLLAEMSLQHRLNLTDPVSKYLPENVHSPVRNGKEISLLSLSTHRSGMPRFPYNADPKDIDKPYVDYTTGKLYEYISHFEPPFDIDSKWRYSNIGYGLLGQVLHLVSHKNFETMVTEDICKPLHMDNTSVSLTAKQRINLAIGHASTGTEVGLTELGAIDAGGALRSNVNDLLTFAAANIGLSTSSLFPAMELTHKLQAKKDGNDTYTTMGWTLVDAGGKQLLFKDGGMPGYTSFLGIDKKTKTGVVVLSNSNNSVSDIGWHLLDSSHHTEPYQYPWTLLDTLRAIIRKKGVNAAIAAYPKMKSSVNRSLIFNEQQLNYLGNELRIKGKIKEAIKIFALNIKEYPGSIIAYESLGELYRRNNNVKKAIPYFEKAQTLDPENMHWKYILDKLNKK